MKNTFRIMALILALITLVTVTAACGSDNGENAQTEPTGPVTKEVFVYNNGVPTVYNITEGESPSITIPTKSATRAAFAVYREFFIPTAPK